MPTTNTVTDRFENLGPEDRQILNERADASWLATIAAMEAEAACALGCSADETSLSWSGAWSENDALDAVAEESA